MMSQPPFLIEFMCNYGFGFLLSSKGDEQREKQGVSIEAIYNSTATNAVSA